jgi:bifunctional UDP-N-acetylglucosamine pyrophosphorylase/glucosamine-1-phosphate N-acetyltransferase
MSLTCVILAAGLGTRMKSSLPKVLHKLCGKPLLQHVLDTAGELRPAARIVVAGKNVDTIREQISGASISFALQAEPKGTGDALAKALPLLRKGNGTVLVLYGDTPLVTATSLRALLRCSKRRRDALSVLSFRAADPTGYGRIVRGPNGKALRIVEEKDASPAEKKVAEVNSGIYVMRPEALRLLKKIRVNAAKGEYYLTDLFEIANSEGLRTGVYELGQEEEMLGVNTRRELLSAEMIHRRRVVSGLMDRGVWVLDPASVIVHSGVQIGPGSVLYPNVLLEGATRIGKDCVIYPNVRIADSVLEDGSVVKDSSVVEQAKIGRDAQVGPFAHLRPGTILGPSVKIGNFVETKKTIVGKGTKASHLSYLGDAEIGSNVNIGAGTITCNYDGKAKHRTVIGNNVFIGSDSQLVAPVVVGVGAYVGAGSTITHDVPADALALSRARQRTIEGWAGRKKKDTKGAKG